MYVFLTSKKKFTILITIVVRLTSNNCIFNECNNANDIQAIIDSNKVRSLDHVAIL